MPQTVKEPTDIEIRQAIASTIRNAVNNLYGGEIGNGIIIHDHWLWGFSLGENASLLRVKAGQEKNQIHGWIIGLNAISRQRPSGQTEVADRQGAYRLRKVGVNRRDLLRSYRVWCYHQLDTGDSDSNSENRLAIETEAVADEFSKNPLMGIDNEWLMGNEELQFGSIDVFKFGEAQANVAQGTLNVRVHKPLDLNQY
jgi:hypothetical protein